MEADAGVGPEGWLGWSAHPPLGGAAYRKHAPSSSEMAVGLFGLFASCPEFAPAAPAVLFSPL